MAQWRCSCIKKRASIPTFDHIRNNLQPILNKPFQAGDSKSFYKHIRLCRENSSHAVPDLIYKDSTAGTSVEKANMLNFFF